MLVPQNKTRSSFNTMNIFTRHTARIRIAALAGQKPHLKNSWQNTAVPHVHPNAQAVVGTFSSTLAIQLGRAQLNYTPKQFVIANLLLSLSVLIATSLLFTPLVGGVLATASLFLPISFVNMHARKFVAEFTADYPTLLLTAASSLKVGMSPYSALERAVFLLPKDSVMRTEVEHMLHSLARGTPKHEAVRNFACHIDQPEIALFRSAFLLVVEHGGRFAPTLERLAKVSRDRTNLISAAKVSTATMRMTANILLAITPLLLLLVSGRSADYWHLLVSDPVASKFAAVGSSMLFFGYLALRNMSSFKP